MKKTVSPVRKQGRGNKSEVNDMKVGKMKMGGEVSEKVSDYQVKDISGGDEQDEEDDLDKLLGVEDETEEKVFLQKET